MMLHHSHLPFFRTPQDAVPCGTKVTFRFVSDEAEGVFLRLWDGEEQLIPMVFDGITTYSANHAMPDTPRVMWYDFLVQSKDGEVAYGNAADMMGGEGCVQGHDRRSFQITVYDPAFQTPAYMHGAHIYQIFPDRFYPAATQARCTRPDRYIHPHWDETPILMPDPATGNVNIAADFFGGTLNGISEKLPYLKDLGVTVIYLNPIFESQSNHRYNTGDYTRVDAMLGTEEEFQALCQKADAMGLRVMLDGVFSHTGSDSVYFNKQGRYPTTGAYQSMESAYYPWYQFMQFPQVYKSWWGFDTLPEINEMDESYRKFMFDAEKGIVPMWIKNGACGWRLDVADELPMAFLRELRLAARKTKKDAVILGEVWEDASNKEAYGEQRCYCLGDTLDSVMNYPLRDSLIAFLKGEEPAQKLARLIRHQMAVYPVPFYFSLMNLIGSHDRSRAVNVFCGKTYENLPLDERGAQRLTDKEYALGVQRLQKAYEILFALPGAPTVYYGDEAGMQGGPDPFCRGTFPWGREDQTLTGFVKERLRSRMTDDLLLYGKMRVRAIDADTIEITRFFDGEDAFLSPRSHAEKIFVISRK